MAGFASQGPGRGKAFGSRQGEARPQAGDELKGGIPAAPSPGSAIRYPKSGIWLPRALNSQQPTNLQLFPHSSDAVEQCSVSAEEVEDVGLEQSGRLVGIDNNPAIGGQRNVIVALHELPGLDAAFPFEVEAVGFGNNAGNAQHGQGIGGIGVG